ncbi:MAG TPA: hypothetical protein VIG80_10635 [Bacillaceae bacterium]
MKRIAASMVIVLLAMTIAACGSSIEKEKTKAETNAKEAFQATPQKSNEEYGAIQFYVPSGLTVKDKSPNNIIMEKGSHPYILFYNPNETANSEALYNLVKNNANEVVADQTFKADDRFGYLVIFEAGDGLYEITAGIGGVKATTESTVKTVAEDAELLMQIASSAEVEPEGETAQ